jgi:hypothetical protein
MQCALGVAQMLAASVHAFASLQLPMLAHLAGMQEPAAQM